jgi:hypothetical protein
MKGLGAILASARRHQGMKDLAAIL